MKDNVVKTFNDYEKILLRSMLGLLFLALSMFGVLYLFAESIGSKLSSFAGIVLVFMLASVIGFVTSIVRIVRFIVVIRKRDTEATIWRSVISFFLAPSAFLVYEILIIIISLSSCTVS